MTVSPSPDYLPSRSPRARDQVARFEATDGAEANTLDGRPVVVLTMTGARTGRVRKTPVMRVVRDGTYVAVASAGGQPDNPAWYHNLVAHPVIELQDGAERRTVRAREIHGAEKRRWWSIADSFWPPYADYRARSPRDIPLFLLEPVGSGSQGSD
ncbi:nitroreductase family deazaflavin-dependent oxidoreductase [Actinoplanes sp. L3-i22]|uniref:nitroreductase family deazaflavin-dependent oxidoreductase n=1 Tax=Actinoplanes sp. L3-i22 TaxID=2836373 RepID=UPI001C745B6B|nr:nitroreductase family deazaflavin-dependent oxidoreductase [Actinoplanes sp. L3-i22]BCY09142.1 nitroreductase [Actinoplanes sp. L3-i22]